MKTIQQVAEETGLSPHTLRYYERIGLIDPVERAATGHRRYSDHDIAIIVFLTHLRSTDMPIAEMQRYMTMMRDGVGTAEDRLRLLEEHRDRVAERLEEIQTHLALIDHKITNYKSGLERRRRDQEAAVS